MDTMIVLDTGSTSEIPVGTSVKAIVRHASRGASGNPYLLPYKVATIEPALQDPPIVTINMATVTQLTPVTSQTTMTQLVLSTHDDDSPRATQLAVTGQNFATSASDLFVYLSPQIYNSSSPNDLLTHLNPQKYYATNLSTWGSTADPLIHNNLYLTNWGEADQQSVVENYDELRLRSTVQPSVSSTGFGTTLTGLTNEMAGTLSAVVTVKGVKSDLTPLATVRAGSVFVYPSNFKIAKNTQGAILELRGYNFGLNPVFSDYTFAFAPALTAVAFHPASNDTILIVSLSSDTTRLQSGAVLVVVTRTGFGTTRTVKVADLVSTLLPIPVLTASDIKANTTSTCSDTLAIAKQVSIRGSNFGLNGISWLANVRVYITSVSAVIPIFGRIVESSFTPEGFIVMLDNLHDLHEGPLQMSITVLGITTSTEIVGNIIAVRPVVTAAAYQLALRPYPYVSYLEITGRRFRTDISALSVTLIPFIGNLTIIYLDDTRMMLQISGVTGTQPTGDVTAVVTHSVYGRSDTELYGIYHGAFSRSVVAHIIHPMSFNVPTVVHQVNAVQSPHSINTAALPERENAIYSESFEGFNRFVTAGTTLMGALDSPGRTGLTVYTGGEIPGWTKVSNTAMGTLTVGSTYGVDLASNDPTTPSVERNYALMLYADDVYTLITTLAANHEGVKYVVNFRAGPAMYDHKIHATGADDGIRISIIRTDGTTLAAYNHLPGTFAGNLDNWSNDDDPLLLSMTSVKFVYTGDGTGDIRVVMSTINDIWTGRFGGTIDDLVVAKMSAPSTVLIGGTGFGSSISNIRVLLKVGDTRWQYAAISNLCYMNCVVPQASPLIAASSLNIALNAGVNDQISDSVVVKAIVIVNGVSSYLPLPHASRPSDVATAALMSSTLSATPIAIIERSSIDAPTISQSYNQKISRFSDYSIAEIVGNGFGIDPTKLTVVIYVYPIVSGIPATILNCQDFKLVVNFTGTTMTSVVSSKVSTLSATVVHAEKGIWPIREIYTADVGSYGSNFTRTSSLIPVPIAVTTEWRPNPLVSSIKAISLDASTLEFLVIGRGFGIDAADVKVMLSTGDLR